ncbi:MAG: DUF3575 domain-containing protein [Bacteroidia bacterium]|nr:DUF3575 domain-containing protein [Bacteroidia bacterium]
MKTRLFGFALLMALSVSAIAQSNVIKITPLRLLTRQVNVGYERKITDKLSIGLNGGFYIPFSSSDSALFGQIDFSNGGDVAVQQSSFGGLTVTPELRVYFSQKGALRGFHLDPFLRYFNYNIGVDGVYQDPTEGNSDISSKFRFSGGGAGLSLGFQGIVADIISIDWFIGGGAGVGGFRLDLSAEGPLEDDIDSYVDDVRAELNAQLPGLGDRLVQESSVADGYRFRIPAGVVPIFRTGLAVGIAF